MAKGGLAVCVATSGRPVPVQWAMSLPLLTFPVGMSIAWLTTKSLERAKNREFLLEQAIKYECSHALFLDDDTVCPPFGPQWLFYELSQDPQAAICGGIYCTKENPPSPLVFDALGGGPKWNWKQNEVFECAGLGTGCMMIDLKKLQTLSKPWFQEIHTAHQNAFVEKGSEKVTLATEQGTDDLYLCKKVTDAGYRILAHGGVLPEHINADGAIFRLPDDSYPLQEPGRFVKRVKNLDTSFDTPEIITAGVVSQA